LMIVSMAIIELLVVLLTLFLVRYDQQHILALPIGFIPILVVQLVLCQCEYISIAISMHEVVGKR
jgi:hypothetical protein